jgi:hypothetical protein
VRAHGGYIIAPGVRTRSGVYTPLEGAVEPGFLPPWLAKELERTGHLSVSHAPTCRPVPERAHQAAVFATAGGNHRLEKTLSSVLADVAACGRVSEGAGFSSSLNRAAYTIGGLVASGLLSRNLAERVLHDVAEAARPGQKRRAEQIIRSGLTAGAQRPLYLGRRP